MAAPAGAFSSRVFHSFCTAVLTCPEAVAPAILSPVSALDIIPRPKSDSESEFYSIYENALKAPIFWLLYDWTGILPHHPEMIRMS